MVNMLSAGDDSLPFPLLYRVFLKRGKYSRDIVKDLHENEVKTSLAFFSRLSSLHLPIQSFSITPNRACPGPVVSVPYH